MERLAAFLLLALVVAGVATASRGDPKKELTPADQARAKSMLLRQADIPQGFKATKHSSDDRDRYCKALDESDLVQTGDAQSLDFERKSYSLHTLFLISSDAQIYKTTAQSAESWRRETSAAGLKCAELLLRRELIRAGGTLVSFKQTDFPSLAPQTVAYRVTTAIPNSSAHLIFDVVSFRNGRAVSTVNFVGAPIAYPRFYQTRLARLVAGRMATAMPARRRSER